MAHIKNSFITVLLCFVLLFLCLIEMLHRACYSFEELKVNPGSFPCFQGEDEGVLAMARPSKLFLKCEITQIWDSRYNYVVLSFYCYIATFVCVFRLLQRPRITKNQYPKRDRVNLCSSLEQKICKFIIFLFLSILRKYLTSFSEKFVSYFAP